MGLSVTVLGCSGSFPAPGGACSGYLVQDAATRIWLDAGSGTLANLQRHVSLADVDAVVLSHEHPDHWSDLEGFHIVLRNFLERAGFPVYAPTPLKRHVYQDMSPWVVWHDVADSDQVDIGSLRLTFSRTDHGPETLAVRVDAEAGGSFGYTADTGPGWSVEQLGPGLDGVLAEATLPREMEGTMQHLSGRQAGAMARDAGAKRLVLTHRWPYDDDPVTLAEGAAAFGGPTQLAEVGKVFEW